MDIYSKLRDSQKPMKLFYMGNVYRADGKSRGGARELYQIGGEIYGCTGKWPDIELISMLRGCFGESGVSGYTIDIGHAGIVNGILNELQLTEQKKEYIRTLVSRKNLVELENEVSRLGISSRCSEAVLKLPCLFGRPGEVFEKIDEIVLNETVRESADYLFEMYERLRGMGLGQSLIIDAGMTGNVSYYTGIIFKAYAQGTSNVVISGGRYDGLMEKLGLRTPAAGFAVYIDGMVEALEAQGVSLQKNRKVLAVFNENRFAEASEHAESLRKSGVTVNLLNYNDCVELEQYAAEYGYDEILKFD
jgi:ATP phosphoribosyltransferase regulatory subunit